MARDRKPIDIFASMRDVSKAGATGEKFAILISSPDGGFLVDLDEKKIAKEYASAVTAGLRDGLLAGDLIPQNLDADTTERRETLEDQGERGGSAHPRYVDVTVRQRIRSNYDQEYLARTPALAKHGPFVPKAGRPRGVVSRMLANSFLGRMARGGKAVVVYTAAARATAVLRVFGQAGLDAAMGKLRDGERFKAAAQAALAGAVRKTSWENGRALARSVADAAGALLELVEEVAEEDVSG